MLDGGKGDMKCRGLAVQFGTAGCKGEKEVAEAPLVTMEH